MEYMVNNTNLIRGLVNNLTSEEKDYLRYLRVKQHGKEHWTRKRYKRN